MYTLSRVEEGDKNGTMRRIPAHHRSATELQGNRVFTGSVNWLPETSRAEFQQVYRVYNQAADFRFSF